MLLAHEGHISVDNLRGAWKALCRPRVKNFWNLEQEIEISQLLNFFFFFFESLSLEKSPGSGV